MTRWANDVNPASPLPEYPRPQMVRKDWLNLNGVWEFQTGLPGDPLPIGRALSGRIVVPFPVESALSGVMLHFERLWYRRTFTVPQAWTGKRVVLNFGAVDFESEVYVNGKGLGVHRGGYDPFSYDITPYLNSGDAQEIIVRVYDSTDSGGQPRGKQSTNPDGIMYTPTTGIWQTVWLEPVDNSSIRSLRIVPDVDKSELHIDVAATYPAKEAEACVVVKDTGKVIQKVCGKVDNELSIPIPNAKLWSPDSPFLYDLDVTLNAQGVTTDEVTSYFGMRKIGLETQGANKKIMLNNRFVFELGPLDQGFWPDGIYTAPTDEALKSDVETIKALGFNTVRKHEKVEPARWYFWTDKLGLLVWQDMPSPDAYLFDLEARPPVEKTEFESELHRMIETHWNSPSIIVWTIFNEGQGQFDAPRLVDAVKTLDPSRLVNEASGADITGAGDLNDLHQYPEPGAPNPTPTQALVNGEYGGIGYLVHDHSWKELGSGYTNVSSPDDLLYLYAEYANKVKRLRDEKGLSAAIYTQLTDVMTEVNGLLTYDRIPKVDVAAIARANRFMISMPSYRAIVPTSENTKQSWKYAIDRPGSEWASPGFNDAQWSEGEGGFGNLRDLSGTSWTSSEIWLRKQFNPEDLTRDQIQNLVVRDFHIGNVEIYVNGILAYAQAGQSDSWEYRGLSVQARDSIRPNTENVLAIHCLGPGKDQFVDAGLDVRASPDLKAE